jgi:outer membrane receptor protein involved in Fe transport
MPIEMLRIRASAGRSFRAPSLAELYLPDLQINPYFTLKANPDLKPEYIWGFDGGFDLYAHENLTAKIGAFYNAMDHLISQRIVLDSGASYVTHRNVTSAWSRGIEMEIDWKALPWLTASSHATIEGSADKTYNVPLDYVPDYLFGCAAAMTRKFDRLKVEGRLTFNYVGSRSYLDFADAGINGTPQGAWELRVPPVPLSSYGTMDVSCKVWPSGGIWIALTVQNLFNAEYEEAAGNLAPGRFALLKMGLDF